MNITRRKNTPLEYRKALKAKAMTVAMKEFKQHGIKAVKMDDIAHILGISKRTLYEIYSNKEEVLLEGIKKEHEKKSSEMSAYATGGDHNVMDVLMHFYHMQTETLVALPPQYFADMQRFPSVVEYFRSKQDEHYKHATAFFRRGVEEGYFRDDVDYALITELGRKLMDGVVEARLYDRYPLPYIFHNTIFLFLRGFCTAKGVEVFDELLKKNL